MGLKLINITSGPIGPNVTGSPVATCGLIGNAIDVAGADKFKNGTIYRFTNVAQAEAVGITPGYDNDNDLVLHYHIAEFYRMAPVGTELWVLGVPQSVTPDVMLQDNGAVYAKKLIVNAGGEIRRLGVVFNPAPDYTETLLDGMNSHVRAAIARAEQLHQWAYDDGRELNVIIEGRGMSASPASWLNLRDIEVSAGINLFAEHVTVCAAQDYAYADTLHAFGKKHAAVGTFLGTAASCQMNQNPGEVESFNITDSIRGYWIQGGLSCHATNEDADAYLNDLDAKGYVFAHKVNAGTVSGYRWNSDHTCTPVVIDAEGRMNQFSMSLGITMGEIRRSLTLALIPKLINKTFQLEPTGELPIGTIKAIEGYGDEVFGFFANNRYITAGKMYVDGSTRLNVPPPVVLNTSFEIVPTGTINRVRGYINFKTNLNG
jgi:Protein of unknown function (DUF2586)